MLQVSAEDYVLAGRLIEQLASEPGRQRTVYISDEARQYYEGELTQLRDLLHQLELRITVTLLDDTIPKLREHPSWEEAAHEIELIQRAMAAELADRIFLFIPTGRAKFFEEFEGADFDKPFGKDVAERFPSAMPDIREATRCIALGHDTACVFHLMRVLEHGLAAFAGHFSVPFAYENWKNVLDQIEARIRRLEDLPKGAEKSEDQQFYSEAAKEFRLFKDAWRNHVMHGRGTYEFREAEKLLAHVGDFMRHIATRLGEAQ